MNTKGPAATATDGTRGVLASGKKVQMETGASSRMFSETSVVPLYTLSFRSLPATSSLLSPSPDMCESLTHDE